MGPFAEGEINNSPLLSGASVKTTPWQLPFILGVAATDNTGAETDLYELTETVAGWQFDGMISQLSFPRVFPCLAVKQIAKWMQGKNLSTDGCTVLEPSDCAAN